MTAGSDPPNMADSPSKPAPAGTAARTEMPVVELGAKDLPAFCPNPAMPLWSGHPRVFLDLAHTGNAACPYCGTRYRLAPGTIVKGH